MTTEALIRTAARWKIPRDLALDVLERDRHCIYCRRALDFSLSGPRAGLPSWEHIVNDLANVSAFNIALCCVGCNSSKGKNTLVLWLQSTYCVNRGIRIDKLAPIAAAAIPVSTAPTPKGTDALPQ
jgi:hypothetical protein